MITQSNPTCTSASSNVSNSLTCQYESSTRTLTVTGAFISPTTDDASFKVNTIRNPPSPDALSGFSFQIQDNSGYTYESYTPNASLSVTVNETGSLSLIQIFPDGPGVVSENIRLYFNSMCQNPFPASAKVQIKVPPEFKFDNTIEAWIGYFSSPASIQILSEDTVQLSNITNSYINDGGTLGFSLSKITAPSSTKPTAQGFTITTYTSTGKPIDTGISASYIVDPGTITQNGSISYITLSNKYVNQQTTYQFEFKITHVIGVNGSFSIEFPNEVQIQDRDSTTACIGPLLGLDNAAKCQVSNQKLTILSGLPTGASGGTIIRLAVDKVTNPITTQPTTSFKIYSHPDQTTAYKIDQVVSGVTVTASPAPLGSVTVTPSSDVTGDVTKYRFEIEITNELPIGGYIVIIFPTGIAFSDLATAQTSCDYIQNLDGSTNCVLQSNKITLENGITTVNLPKNSVIIFEVNSVKNPPSTAKYQSFTITTYDQQNHKINETNSNIFIQLANANILTSASVVPGSKVNGEQTNYTFTVTVFNETPTNFKIKVYPPTQIQIPISFACSGVSGISAISCIDNTDHIEGTVTLTGSTVTSSTPISFQITNFTNPPSTAPTSSFKLYTFTNNGFKIDKKESGIIITTETAATLEDIIISAENSNIAVVTTYTISYTPVNIHPIGTTIKITVPSVLKLEGTASCSSTILSSSLQCLITGQLITLSQGFDTAIEAPNKITFQIQGIRNPAETQTTSPWTLLSQTGTYKIDKSEDQTTEFTCASPCFTCLTTATTCTSCDSASSTPYFYNDTCNASCQQGQVDLIATPEKVCSPCASECLTCQDTAQKCMSCDTNGTKPFLYSDTCNETCPAGKYGEGMVCKNCVNPCLECSSSDICKTCTERNTQPDFGAKTYFYSGQCLIDCPIGYMNNSTTKTCDQCNIKCKDCETDINICTACESPLKLKEGDCVTACPTDNRYIDTGPSCERCQSPCDQCTTTISQCTSCLTGNLYQSQCVQTCPAGTVAVNKQCKPCSSECETCEVAVNACTACSGNFYVYKSQCIEKCPTGTVVIGNECKQCEGCATCEINTTTCTSCSAGTYLYNSQCINECPVGTHVPINRVCEECSADCKTCEGAQTNCKSCNAGLKLYQGGCVLNCPDGTLNVDGVCQACDSSCSKCGTSVDNCTECPNGKLLEAGACVDACSGTFIQLGSTCSACHSSCLTCKDNTTNCITCKTNTYLYQNTCLANCPEGWMPVTGVCQEIIETECNANCTTLLLNNNSCDTVCNVEACAFDKGKCVIGPTNCPDGQYQLGDQCFPCGANCNTCASENTCLSCKDSQSTGSIMLLYEGLCYDTCPEGTYKNGLICQTCASKCKTCVGTADTCTSCNGLLLYNNNCLNSCPADTSIQVGADQCSDCSINCKFCDGTFDNCTACVDGKVLLGNQCRSQCPDNYTLTVEMGNVCQQCGGNCLRCSGSVNNCTQCAENKVLYSGECLDACPEGTYQSGSVCKDCSNGCVTCSSETICLTCENNLVKFNTLCMQSCPSGYQSNQSVCEVIPAPTECSPGCTTELLTNALCDQVCNTDECNKDNQACVHSGECPLTQYFDGTTCQDCQWPCSSCTAPSSCTACSYALTGENTGKTMLLYNDFCYEACPAKTLKNGLKCEDCNPVCKSCAGTVDTCIECEGSFLYNGTCVAECPVDVTVGNGSVCQNCSSACGTCETTASTCTSCADGKVLYENKCYLSCPSGTTTTASSPKTCKICTANCLTCSTSTSSCDSCVQGKLLYNKSCLDTCPVNISVQKGDTCEACQSPCVNCENEVTLCTSCENGFNLAGQACSNNCPSGYEPRLGICEPLCAEGCSLSLLNNTDCDIQCNYKSCNYDNGVCVPNDCPIGQYRSGENCVNCQYPCNTCSSASYCKSCQVANDGTNAQLLSYEGTCSLSCPSGTLRDGLVCLACNVNCKECGPDVDTCTQCNAKKLYNGTCINTCPSQISIENNGICEPCNLNCKTCSGDVDTCTSCNEGAVLSGGRCVSECEPGYTTTTASAGKCVACEGNCTTCQGDTTYCLSCSTGILHQGGCLQQCPAGYTNTTAVPTKCTKCSDNCIECTNTIDTCTACLDTQQLTSLKVCQDLPTCPDGTTLTPTTGATCKNCLAPCTKCENDVNRCTECISGLVLDNYTCIQCNSPCKECTGNSTTCTSCEEGYYLSGTKCLQCSSNCVSCSGNSFTCTSCKTGEFLSGGQCMSCSDTCKTCENSPGKCTSCESGLFLENDQCIGCSQNCLECQGSSVNCTSCPAGSYLDGTICKTCDQACKECKNSATNCTACAAGQTLINGVCGVCKATCASCQTDFNVCTGCAEGLALIAGECDVCNVNCKTCVTDFNTCGSCDEGKFLFGGGCVVCDSSCKDCVQAPTNCTSCDAPLSLISNQCVTCDSPCKTCIGTKSNCSTCEPPLQLINNTCLACADQCKTCSGATDLCTSCEDHKYLSSNTCLECSSSCLTCTQNADNCTSCASGSELVGNTCLITCPEGYTRSGQSCILCDANCKTCSGSAKTCTSCNTGFLFNNICVTSCPEGYFKTGETCESCQSLCNECVGSRTNCLSCKAGYKLSGTTCIPICVKGQYLDGGVCIQCDPDCASCQNASDNCTSCSQEGYVVNAKGRCELPCEEGFVRTSSSNGQCVPCSSTCKTCSVQTTYCTECQDESKFLYIGQCLGMCPLNTTVPVGKICEECDRSCLTCSGNQSTCASCVQDKYLYQGLCLSECPEGYEVKLNKCKLCEFADNCPYVPPDKPDNDGEEEEDPEPTPIANEDEEPEDLKVGKVPFPFSGVGVLGILIVVVSKIASATMSFVPAAISTWSIAGTLSWFFLGAWVYLFGEDDSSELDRRLVALDPTSGELLVSMALLLILLGVGFHILLNLLFWCTYTCNLTRKDLQYTQ